MPGLKKEQLEKASKSSLPPLVEIGRDELLRDDAVYFLGMMAARELRAFGQITMMMGADDKVCVANPTLVYLDANAIVNEDMPERPDFRWVRPILGSGRPQFVAWKDGELWEIEFKDDLQVPEDSGSSDHQ